MTSAHSQKKNQLRCFKIFSQVSISYKQNTLVGLHSLLKRPTDFNHISLSLFSLLNPNWLISIKKNLSFACFKVLLYM